MDDEFFRGNYDFFDDENLLKRKMKMNFNIALIMLEN